MTTSRPRPDLAQRPAAQPSPGLKISLVQVIATALAAITATVVASFLGVAGTVVGAAVASTLSVVGTAVYSHSLRRTHERVRAVVPARRTASSFRAVPRGDGGRGGSLPDPHGVWAQPTYYPARAATTRLDGGTGRRSLGARVAIGSAALFAAVLAVVTGVEAVAQRPISDLVRGESGSGTTLFGSSHSSSAARVSTAHRRHAAHHAGHRAARRSGTPTVTRTVTRTVPGTGTASAPASTPASTPPSDSPPPSPSDTGTATAGGVAGAIQP